MAPFVELARDRSGTRYLYEMWPGEFVVSQQGHRSAKLSTHTMAAVAFFALASDGQERFMQNLSESLTRRRTGI